MYANSLLPGHALTFASKRIKRGVNTHLVTALGFYVKGLIACFVDDGSTKPSSFVGIKKGMTSC